jgi:FKBP-type peptidyl-prolyl cis-trans isomerase SlyD
MTNITQDKVVGFTYILKDSEGIVLDESSDSEPLEYLHGHQNIISGLESELEGLQVGDKKDIIIQPQDGYGLPQDSLIQSFPKTSFPDDIELEVGLELQADTPNGPMAFIVMEIKEDEVIMDGNHPLAGETLFFAVEIKSVRPATQEELDHGHAHGAHGHHHH